MGLILISVNKRMNDWCSKPLRLKKAYYVASLWWQLMFNKVKSESRSVVSDSLWPHGLYSSWNSPGQNTGVGSLSLLQGIFPTQGLNPGLLCCWQILYQLSHQEAQEHWSGQPVPSPADLPDPGIEPGSPALQADSLPTELSGKPNA